MNTCRIVSLWFAQGLAIELPLSHVIHTRSMGCGSQPPWATWTHFPHSEKSILPCVPRGYLQHEQCKLNLDSSLEVEGSEKSRKCEWAPAAQGLGWLWAGGGPGPTAVTACYCRWAGALTQTLREGRWKTCLHKAFPKHAFSNYTFIIPFCIFNSNLQMVSLIMVGF